MSRPNTFPCPRCGEPLPEGHARCDACGAYIVGRGGAAAAHDEPRHKNSGGPRPAARGGHRPASGMPSWAFLLIGLAVGGAVGYSLRAAVAPRDDSGMMRGPADVMGAADAGGMASNQMLPGVIEALARYSNVLAEDPDNIEANIGMGNLMFDSNKRDQAIEHYTKALERDPTNADVRVDRAIAYHTLGQNQKAFDEMKRVTKEQPTHKNAWLNLGVVAGAMGDRKANVEAWEQYLKLEPSGPHSDAIRQELAKAKGA
jgi:tetratricopeptide (TPR) repeat protein